MAARMDVTAAASDGPYAGPRAFGVADQDIFFGRDREIETLRSLWRGSQLVVMHGPAGCGKTSLLNAGIIPALSKAADVLPPGRVLAGSSFPEALLPDHNPYCLSVLAHWSPIESRSRLAQLSLAEFLHRRSVNRTGAWASVPTHVAIDQLEDVFVGNRSDQHRNEFFDDLAAAMRELPGLRVLLSTRTDTLSDLAPYIERLQPGPGTRVTLGPLTHEAAVEAVWKPMEAAGHQFGEGAAEYLVEKLSSADPGSYGHDSEEGIAPAIAAPVELQLACQRLWQAVIPRTSTISLAFVRRNVDLEQVLVDFCADAIAQISAWYQVTAPRLSAWLAGEFLDADGGRAVVDEGSRAKAGLPGGVLRALVSQRVLATLPSPGKKKYRLASDRLAQAIQYLHSRPRSAWEPVLNVGARLQAAETTFAEGELAIAQMHAEEVLDTADLAKLGLLADARSLLGNIAYQRGMYDLAEQHYNLAAELREQQGDQSSVGRLFGAIGKMHARQGLYLAALAELQAAVTRLPGDPELHTELATVLWRTGQSQAASAVFGTVLTVEPDSAGALAGRGQIRAERGNAYEALEDLMALQRLRPRASLKPEVRSAYALALAGAGRTETAMEEANAAVASAHDSGIIFLRAARVAWAGGALKRATELLGKAQEATHPALTSDQLIQARRLLDQVSQPVGSGRAC
jgi:tetratricopeptide (TPR) repeat protein